MTHRSGEGETAAAEKSPAGGAPAHATVMCAVPNAVFCTTDGVSGTGPQVKTYSFSIGTAAQYVASLVEIPFPSAFDKLSLGIAQTGGSLINSTAVPGSFNFAANPGSYSLLLFGDPGAEGGGFFSITVAPLTGTQISPVPEPGMWLMMGAGALLVGFVRLRARVGS